MACCESFPAQDDYDMHYQSATKIQEKLECNLLVVTSSHVILCQVDMGRCVGSCHPVVVSLVCCVMLMLSYKMVQS